jgi:hypothetical protein
MLPQDWRQQLSKVYPKRNGQGWQNAKRQIIKHLEEGESFEEMLTGADNYRRHIAESGEFVRMAQTFFGPAMFWTEFQESVVAENEVTLDDEAGDLGLKRGPNESDESLKTRIGIAQTKALYG